MKAKTIVAIAAITLLLAIALFKGIDGALLSSGIAVIAGIAGYEIGKIKTRKKQ